jgi:hypothetical protein
MRSSHDEFLLTYGSEVRESLIMIEGDDGSFELLGHGWLAGNKDDDGTLFTLVRSRNTDRTHLLVRDTDRSPRRVYHWHRVRPEAQRALQDRLISLQYHADETEPASRTDGPSRGQKGR